MTGVLAQTFFASAVPAAGGGGGGTEFITGDQAYAQKKYTNSAFAIYDCDGATFRVQQDDSLSPMQHYPFWIEDAIPSSVEAFGGVTLGEIDPAMTWEDVYNIGGSTGGNSAAVLVREVGCELHNWTFGSSSTDAHCFDLIRLRGTSAQGLRHVHDIIGWGWRDDIIEADDSTFDLLIEDCFFENGFAGISLTGTATGRTVTMDNVLIRLTDRFYYEAQTRFTHSSMFKVDAAGPNWVVNNCVFAIETPDYPGYTSRTATAFANWSGTGNEWLVCGATQHASHPALPSGFTLYEGSAAESRWAARKAAFLGLGSISFVASDDDDADATINVPTNVAGDLLVFVVWDHSASTDPGAITDWTRLTNGSQSSGTNRLSVYYRVSPGGVASVSAASGSECAIAVYRPSGGTIGVGPTATVNPGSTSTIVHPAIDLDNENGTSWVFACDLHRNVAAAAHVTPSMTQREEVFNNVARNPVIADTNGGVASWAGSTWTGMTGAAVTIGISFEIKVT